MASKNDLALAVLEDLGVVAAGENATAADSQLVIRRYNRLHEELVTKGIAYWESSTTNTADTIPNRVMGALTKLTANACADAFSLASDDNVELSAMRRLHALTENERAEQPTQATYY